jgi:hypothetical protein
MAHEVRVKINTAVVAHKDLEVIVSTDEGKLGTLLISKGNLEWLPTGNSVNKRRLSWKQFSKFMEDYGRAVKAK